MTDTPEQPYLLDRIKAAMRSFDYRWEFDETERKGYWHIEKNGELFERRKPSMNAREDRIDEAVADLNARAVIDAIVGALRWEDDNCFLANALVGVAYSSLSEEKWCACIGGPKILWFPTESEARAAVEAAFRAALMGEGNE